MGAIWESDKRNIRPDHDWAFSSISKYEWGFSVTLYCKNQGCMTQTSRPLKIEPNSSVCLNALLSKQIIELEGS